VSIAVEVEEFIVREIALGRGIESVEHDRDLLATEVIDSLGITELISFLEAKYGIAVSDDDLAPENFRSVDGIVAFVEKKRSSR
jgi:acyl carrier protein